MKIKITLIIKALISLIIIFAPIIYFYNLQQNEMVLAWIALMAIIVALFREGLLTLFFRPELKITISNSPEHFDETFIDHDIGMEPSMRLYYKYLGARVENIGVGNAKNVEVYFSGVSSNLVNDFGRYKNIPLKTSWTNFSLIKLLPPNIGIRMDLCFISKNEPLLFKFELLSTPNRLGDIELIPNVLAEFIFEIIAVADNAKLKKIKVKVTYTGNYENGVNVSLMT